MDSITLQKFIQRIEVQPDGCWIWRGPTGGGERLPDGTYWYGRISRHYTHRLAYEHWKGPIPPGLEIDHLCRVTKCCNPEHLEAVTRSVNERRALAIRTHCPAGHLFDDANTYYTPKGHRRCRACHRAESRARYQARK